MTYEDVMAAAQQADAAGEANITHHLRGIAQTLRTQPQGTGTAIPQDAAQPAPSTGPWTKYGKLAAQAKGPRRRSVTLSKQHNR